MESFFRFLKGFVIIEITKSGFSRFINLCLQEHFDLWDIKELQNVILCHVSLNDFRHIKSCVKRSHVKIHIVDKAGVPFMLLRFRSALIWIIGFLICLSAFYYQKTHIWTLHVDGNITITDEQIEDILTTNGLFAGEKINEFDTQKAEQLLCEKFDKISWICVYLDGTGVSVSLIENSGVSYQNQEAYPSSIYASKDGVIERIMVSKGYTELKVGDTVSEGQLLISGDIPYTNNDGLTVYKQVAAQGDYLCRIKEPYFDCIAEKQPSPFYEDLLFDGIHLIYNNNIFGLSFNRFKDKTLYKIKEYQDLNFLSLVGVNICLVKEKRAIGIIEDIIISKEQQLEILNQNLEYKIKHLADNGATNIVKELSVHTENNQMILFGNILYSDSSFTRNRIQEKKDEDIQDVTDSINDGFVN